MSDDEVILGAAKVTILLRPGEGANVNLDELLDDLAGVIRAYGLANDEGGTLQSFVYAAPFEWPEERPEELVDKMLAQGGIQAIIPYNNT